MLTAAVIIIGDEILTGKFPDENGPFLIRRLRELGVSLLRVVTIRDDRETIADEVRRCAALADHVFTTGGVGPTHDDLTFEGVAAAFGLPLEERPELVALLRQFGLALDPMNLRMATVPVGTELLHPDAWGYPILRVRNVVILPGVPKIMRSKFEALAPSLAGEALHTARVYAGDRESEVAVPMAEVAAQYPQVSIGSYPRFDEEIPLIVTFEGADRDAVVAAARSLARSLRVVRTEGVP